jgi:hypothetical protein
MKFVLERTNRKDMFWQYKIGNSIGELDLIPVSITPPPVISPVSGVSLNMAISAIYPLYQEVHYESFTSSRFPSTVSPSKLQKKIPLRPVSLSLPVLLDSSRNVILLVSLRKR